MIEESCIVLLESVGKVFSLSKSEYTVYTSYFQKQPPKMFCKKKCS